MRGSQRQSDREEDPHNCLASDSPALLSAGELECFSVRHRVPLTDRQFADAVGHMRLRQKRHLHACRRVCVCVCLGYKHVMR